jgi:murein DD-endopeptidase MepM/ murein hydrolase activator NlpD
MNPIFQIFTIWSYRKELKYVIFAFLVVLSLPLVAVIILTHTGINIVSDALVNVDSNTRTIEVLNPADGSVVTELHKPIVWPVTGVITLRFGESSLYQIFHTGIDIANPEGRIGDPITPFMDGTVIYAGETFLGFGKHIIIDHGDNITSVYAHLDRIYVYKGKEVHIGDTIGTMGKTGWATGSHLHLEVRVFGIPVDPLLFI